MKAQKAQRSNSRNEALIEAAATLFASQGFKATSMRDIAKAVDMRPGSIYNHVSSKDDLLLAIYETAEQQITELIQRAIEPLADPWERLEAGMAALVRAVTEESAYTRVIFRVKPDEVVRYQAELVDLRDQFEAKFAQLIADLPSKRWVDKHLLRLLMLGAGNHAQLWFNSAGSYSAEEIGKQWSRFIRESVSR